jgi:hypothetical protein
MGHSNLREQPAWQCKRVFEFVASLKLAVVLLAVITVATIAGTITTTSAGTSRTDEATDLEEAIFAFSNAPDEQIGHVRKGGSTGVKVRLVAPVDGNKGYLVVSFGEKETILDVAKNLGRDAPIENTAFTLRIENYWPDFRIANGKPSSFSDEPNNPAVLVTIRGKGVPVSEAEINPHGWRDHL